MILFNSVLVFDSYYILERNRKRFFMSEEKITACSKLDKKYIATIYADAKNA
jgi:hypothetical protein